MKRKRLMKMLTMALVTTMICTPVPAMAAEIAEGGGYNPTLT